MKYKVKWIEDHMSITRNMIRRYEKKGVILRNEKGKDREFDEDDLIQLWNIRVMVSLGFSLDDVKEILSGSNLRKVSDKKIMDELYEWFGIGNDREIFVQVFETYLLCDERFEETFGKEKCCELSALIATYGK